MQNLVVIGLGNISQRHRKNLRALYPTASVYAMPARDIKEFSGCLPDVDGLVFDIKQVIALRPCFVVIASPASLHAKHAVPLIKERIPVLIEKPVSANIRDAKRIVAEVEASRTPVAVGYCLRYLKSARRMKMLLDEMIIGEVYNVHIEVGQYLPDWRPNADYRSTVSASKELGGGALLELSHELDYAEWFLGGLAPQYVKLRSTTELGLDVEDLVDAVCLSSRGAVVSIHLDFLQRRPYRRCRITGSQGSLEWDLVENRIKHDTKSGSEVVFQEENSDKNFMYLEMMRDFQRFISGLPHQCITVAEAANTLSLVETLKSLARIERF